MKTSKKIIKTLGVTLVVFGYLYMFQYHPGPKIIDGFSRALSSNHGEQPVDSRPPPPHTTPRGRRNVTKPVMVVIVSSNPRSGSSFIGELLASPANAIYFFEPFRYELEMQQDISKTTHLLPDKRDYVQNTLLKLLTCRLTEARFNASFDFKILTKPELTVPLTEKQRTSVCHDLDLRVIKVVRPGLGAVLPLLQLPDHQIHIIHIVRDPRAIINSVRENEGWANRLTADKVCANFAIDLDSAQNVTSPRYTMIKYEDLITNTTEQARRLFGRFGLNMTEGVQEFITMHTKSTKYKKPPRFPVLKKVKHLFNIFKSSQLFTNEPRSSSSDAKRRTTQAEPLDTVTRYRHRRSDNTKSWTTNIDFNGFYGTFRDVNFDGLHWLKELPKDIRRDVEQECADVLKRMDYPLLYPGEEKQE